MSGSRCAFDSICALWKKTRRSLRGRSDFVMADILGRYEFNPTIITVEDEETTALLRRAEGSNAAMLWAGALFSEKQLHPMALDVANSLAS